MKFVLATVAIIAAITPTMAQSAAPQSASEQALGQKLMTEINGGLQCHADKISVDQALAKAQARVAELEAKYEPKKPAADEPKK